MLNTIGIKIRLIHVKIRQLAIFLPTITLCWCSYKIYIDQSVIVCWFCEKNAYGKLKSRLEAVSRAEPSRAHWLTTEQNPGSHRWYVLVARHHARLFTTHIARTSLRQHHSEDALAWWRHTHPYSAVAVKRELNDGCLEWLRRATFRALFLFDFFATFRRKTWKEWIVGEKDIS